MQISENKVFVFRFGYEGGDITIPVRADTKEDAVASLQKWMSGIQTELAIEFPRVSAAKQSQANAVLPPTSGAVPDEVLEMRIDTLLNDLGAKGLTDAAKAETVKNWTEKELLPKNYPAIITELELIASGQKEVLVKKKKA